MNWDVFNSSAKLFAQVAVKYPIYFWKCRLDLVEVHSDLELNNLHNESKSGASNWLEMNWDVFNSSTKLLIVFCILLGTSSSKISDLLLKMLTRAQSGLIIEFFYNYFFPTKFWNIWSKIGLITDSLFKLAACNCCSNIKYHHSKMYRFLSTQKNKQECIPVGCGGIPAPGGGGCLLGGVPAPGGGGSAPGGEGVSQYALRQTPLWTDRQV